MTPKEKAIELYAKFLFQTESVDDIDYGFILAKLSESLAKKCALIAIDEICEAINWHEFEVPNEEFNYWNRVKLEIQRL
jgi:hypothetical protein